MSVFRHVRHPAMDLTVAAFLDDEWQERWSQAEQSTHVADTKGKETIMSMTPLRNNVALAIDGGGIKGLIVARALMALEDELGGEPLIKHPQLKVLAGTSTGAIITAAIAMGMKAEEITQLYVSMGQEVFPRLTPRWLPKAAKQADELERMARKPFLYSNEKLTLIAAFSDENAGNVGVRNNQKREVEDL
jgi:hypothetical protein